VNGFVGAGRADLVWQFAYPLPMRVIAEILGVPPADMETFKRWSDDAVARLSVNLPLERQIRCARSLVEFQHYFAAQIEERRARPRDDMLTDLVNARIEGHAPLSVPEMLSLLQQLLVAGNETTTNLIGSMMALVLRQPEILQAVRENPNLATGVVEEALRLESPVQGLFRTTTQEVELGGIRLPKGAHLQLLYASGNRDPAQFACPERLDIHRANAATHLAFGGGIHFCIGAPLARLEGRVALQTLIQRLPNLRLEPGQPLTRVPHFFLRGFEHLYVSWDVTDTQPGL